MEKVTLSLVWWNTSLSPPTTKTITAKKFKLPKSDRLILCHETIQRFMDLNYDFICLGEVSSIDIEDLIEKLDIENSNYTFISGYEKLGNMIFDTCILFNKGYQFNPQSPTRNLIFNSADRKVKTGQRFEFYLPHMNEILVIYLSHWPSRQSADDILYNNIAQDLRSAINSDLMKQNGVILLGDYNVEPHHASMTAGLQTSREKELVKYRKSLLYNPCWKFLTHSQHNDFNHIKSGTHYLRKTGLFNSWHVIDQILVSENFLGKKWNFMDNLVEIIDINAGLNDAIFDHLAVSVFIERA